MSHLRTLRRPLACVVALLALTVTTFAQESKQPAKENQGLPLLFHEDFKSAPDALKKFTFTDKDAWKITDDDVDGAKRPVLALVQQSNYKPPVRSPVNLAWINDLKVSHFVLEARCKSTQKPTVMNRDLCFAFGGLDPSHFLYAHMAAREDKIHNQIHLVDNKDREPVTVKHADKTPWDDKYHTVKITRDDTGLKAYFDGQLLLTTDRKDFPTGRLGFGSFDDIANFAEITVWGKKAE
jgi:hypothetical protein